MFQSAQTELVGMLNDVRWSSEKEILVLLKELKRRKLKIMLVGRNTPDSAEDLSIFRAASGGSVKILPKGELKASFLIKDRTDLVIITDDDPSLRLEQVSTVLVREPTISQMFRGVFEDVWNRSLTLGDAQVVE